MASFRPLTGLSISNLEQVFGVRHEMALSFRPLTGLSISNQRLHGDK